MTPGAERDPWVLGPQRVRAQTVVCALCVCLVWRAWCPFVGALFFCLSCYQQCAARVPSSFWSRHRRRRDCVRVSAPKYKLNQTTLLNSSNDPDGMIYLIDKARDILHFIAGAAGQATGGGVDNINASADSSNSSTRTGHSHRHSGEAERSFLCLPENLRSTLITPWWLSYSSQSPRSRS